MEVREGERPLEDYTKDELVELVRKLSHARRPRREDALEVWRAVDKLRAIAGAEGPIKTVVDYLDPPLDEIDGVRGWWQTCQLCRALFFYVGGGSNALCPGCKPDVTTFQCTVGRTADGALYASFYSPMEDQLVVHVRKGAGAARVAETFRSLAEYADAAASR